MSMSIPLLILISIAALGVVAAVWSFAIERRWWQLTRHSVDHRLDPAEPGAALRVVLLSDLHFYSGFSMGSALIERINRLRPDLVVVAGDLIDRDSGIEPCALELGRLRARAGVFAVLGNHDHYFYSWRDVLTNNQNPATSNDTAALVRSLRAAGIEVLINQSRRLTVGGVDLTLVGLGDHVSGRLAQVRSGAGASEGAPGGGRIVLSHSGEGAHLLGGGERTLALAGHTHGGQIRIPLVSALILFRRLEARHLHGWQRLAGGGRLYVNRGVGTTRVFPFRFNARPEVAVFDLVADARPSASEALVPAGIESGASREDC